MDLRPFYLFYIFRNVDLCPTEVLSFFEYTGKDFNNPYKLRCPFIKWSPKIKKIPNAIIFMKHKLFFLINVTLVF